ncbi:MAG: ABC transporter substrate-binding protein [Chloroflexi bacterium]|nr:ABC transporter substrate-binding protein [Chloroflexota bacterium]
MRYKKWRFISILLVIAFMIPALAACQPKVEAPVPAPVEEEEAAAVEEADEPEEAAPPEPVIMRVGTTSIWDGNNLGVEVTGWLPYRLVFDSIIEFGPNGTFIEGLAESWSVDDSGLVWTFKIRDGITFHDGTPCTAEEVAWSLTWMEEIDFDSIAYMWSDLFEEVVALDANTLQITTVSPISYMEYALSYSFVVPQSVWGEMADHDTMAAYTEIDATTGTGPFVVNEWVPDEYLILDRNDAYWGAVPAFDQLIFQQYATEDAMVNALLASELDGIAFAPATAIATLKEDPNIAVNIFESWGVEELTINSYAEGTQPASLNDPVVRLAMEYAIDRDQINDVVYLGYYTPATTIFAPVLSDWHNDQIETISFDLAMANQTLDDAGYVDGDGDGVREYSDGTPMSYRFLIDDAASSARLAEVIQNGLAQAGIGVSIEAVDYNTQMNNVFYYYDYDLTYWSWGADPDPDFLGTVFSCDQLWWWNDSGYCDAEYDALYAASRTAIDKTERADLVWQMQEKIYNDRPWIVLLYGSVMSSYRTDRFTGFSPEARYLYGKWSILQAEPVQ